MDCNPSGLQGHAKKKKHEIKSVDSPFQRETRLGPNSYFYGSKGQDIVIYTSTRKGPRVRLAVLSLLKEIRVAKPRVPSVAGHEQFRRGLFSLPFCRNLPKALLNPAPLPMVTHAAW